MKKLYPAVLTIVLSCVVTPILNASVAYLIVTPPSPPSVLESTAGTISVYTDVGSAGSGYPEVSYGYTYQAQYNLSGTAIYGTDYTISAKASYFSSYQTISGGPSFYHTTTKGNSAESTIRITILNNAIASGTRTLRITRPAGNSFEAATDFTIRIKDDDVVASGSSYLVNLSTRANAGSGDNVLIGGFILSGSTPRTVLVTGRGPSLTGLGVSNAITDPLIALNNSSGQIAVNDDWGTASNSGGMAATGYAPPHNKESAIMQALQPASHTVVVNNLGSGGVGMFELYALPDGSSTKLVNLSSRAFVGTGDGVLIVGFVINGGPKKILINGKGPSLTQYGLNGLSNPNITLYSGSTVLEDCTQWGNAWNASDIYNLWGLKPTSSQESSILEVLPAGVYTVILRGVGSGTGVGLVEIWEIP